MSVNEEQTNVVRFIISYINRFNISLGIAMKIVHLVKALDEAGARSAAQQASMQAAATGRPQTSVSTTQTAPAQQSTQTAPAQQSTQTATAQQSAHPDPTLAQPLPPRDPNAPGIGTKIGQGIGKIAKGIGAVAGVPAGIGRAIKKGYQAGANTVGGPGAAQPDSSTPTAASAAGQAELDQLKATLQSMDQRLRRAGFESKK